MLQHPQSFPPKIKNKNKKIGMELVKFSGFKKNLFKKVMETLRRLRIVADPPGYKNKY